MGFTYGFYNSVDHDRFYDAKQFSSIFDGVIVDGVFNNVPINGSTENNDRFRVSKKDAMSIKIGRGKAWFNHTWNLNTTEMVLDIDPADAILNRYDAVVLEINTDVKIRENFIKVIKGTPASSPKKPTMVRSENKFQYALAYVLVRAGIIDLADEDIENVVGTEETPISVSIADDFLGRIRNDLETTDPFYVLDARQGKILNNKIDVENSKLDNQVASLIQTINNAISDFNNRIASGVTDIKNFVTSSISSFNTTINSTINTKSSEVLNSFNSRLNAKVTEASNSISSTFTDTINEKEAEIASIGDIEDVFNKSEEMLRIIGGNNGANGNIKILSNYITTLNGRVPFMFGVQNGVYGYYEGADTGGTFRPF